MPEADNFLQRNAGEEAQSLQQALSFALSFSLPQEDRSCTASRLDSQFVYQNSIGFFVRSSGLLVQLPELTSIWTSHVSQSHVVAIGGAIPGSSEVHF
jgi:hypothetical protein